MKTIRPVTRRPGQALVELAFTAPLLVMILGVIIDFGLGFHTMVNIMKVLQDATPVAARAHSTDDELKTMASALMQQYGLSPARSTLTVSRRAIEGVSAVQLHVAYDYVPLSPCVQYSVGNHLRITWQAVYAVQ
jgi:Flp pilus assembly protein TadG